MDSPVPASMFAPEPSSPGAARAAAAAARLHGGFDSDCSEDGETLNGEPELDLTSKVGPDAGAGAEGTGRRGGPGGGAEQSPGRRQGREGPSPPTCKCGTRGGLSGEGRLRRPAAPLSFPGGAHPASRRPAPAEITTPRLRHVERGRRMPAATRAVVVLTRCRLPRDREWLSPWTVHGSLGSEVAWAGRAGGSCSPRGEQGGSCGSSWCRERKH